MIEQDVKYLKYKTFLNTYCPHCNQSFNVADKETQTIVVDASYNGSDFQLKLSPYLDVFEVESSIPIKEAPSALELDPNSASVKYLPS